MKDNRIQDIIHILNEYEKGNFNVPLPFYESNDEISIIIQKLRSLRDTLGKSSDKILNDEYRLNQILDAIVRITTFDFSEKIELSQRHDALDAIGLGLNMLSHELEKRINELAHKNQELLRLSAVIETTADAVATLSPSGIVTSWNKSSERIYGFSASDILGKKPDGMLMPPSEIPRFENAMKRVKSGEQISNYQTKRTRKDGKIITVSLTLTPIIANNKLVSISVISRDITSEIAQAKLLKESEERYRLLVQSIKNYAIFTIDPKGIILSVNPSVLEVTGYSENELLNQHISIFFSEQEIQNAVPSKNLDLALESGTFRETSWKVKKGGQNMWTEIVTAPFFDEKGELKGYSMVMQDITERKIVEDTMKEHQEQIETIIGNAPSAIIVMDEKSRVLKWNAKAEKIFGWTAEEIMNRPIHSKLLPKQFVEHHYQSIERFLKSGTENVLEINGVRKSGEEFPVELRISAVKSGNKFLYIAFITDITERKQSEDQIRKANQALDASNKELEAFTYSVSHDLRAPIRAIQGYTDLLSEDIKEKLNEEQKSMMSSVVKNTRKMTQLINDLLALSHLGQKELVREKINMNTVINSVLEGIKTQSGSEDTEFIISDLPEAFADYNLMVQVFHNLISNAIKYSSKREHPKVEIGSFKKDNETVYYVKDNGTGFDMKFYDKLFGVFQRLHTDKEYEGTGVGLSIVKRIIDKHHGKIWAESKPDDGATFYFTIESKTSN